MLELACASSLKMKARGIIRGFIIPHDIKKQIIQGIDNISMPLAKYYQCSDDTINQAFVKEVLGVIGSKIDKDLKDKVKSKLMKKF